MMKKKKKKKKTTEERLLGGGRPLVVKVVPFWKRAEQAHGRRRRRRRRRRGVVIKTLVFFCAFSLCVFFSAFFKGGGGVAFAENNATSTLRERTSANARMRANEATARQRLNLNARMNTNAGRENVSSSTTRMREDFRRPDVDAALLYRISGDMIARMRARMPRELVEKGDPVAEARYASARCEDSSGGGVALNFIFDFFDALLEAVSFRTYDKQMNRMYQMHSRTNRSVGNEDGDGNNIAAFSAREKAGDDAIPMINIEDAFYTRAKSFYLANKDDKEQEERLHRALGKYDEGDAFAACPSDINAWTWLFSFFQLDLSSLGTNGTETSDGETPETETGSTYAGSGEGSPSDSPNYDDLLQSVLSSLGTNGTETSDGETPETETGSTYAGSGEGSPSDSPNYDDLLQSVLSSLGTNDDAETPSYSTTTPSYLPDYNFYPPVSSGLIQFLGGIEKCTPGNCIYPRACCDVTQTGHLSCVAHYSMCPDFWCVTFFVE